MKVRVHGFDDVSTEIEVDRHPAWAPTSPGEETIVGVYVHDTHVGQIRYRSRRTQAGMEWGWQPVHMPRNSKLTSKYDAITRLLKMGGPARVAAAAREASQA